VCLLGRFPALTGVDLDVREGEIVLVSGRNGAGKTTLLRLVAGLLPLHSGEAVVLGRDLAVDRKSARHELALMAHETFCYDDLTALENLRFAARTGGASTGDADRALSAVGLERWSSTPARKLSAGQKRRLSLAGVLARRPRLLLLDEPHAGLDADARSVLDAAVRDLAQGGASVLVASHELEHTRPLADREVVIAAGRTSVPPGGVPASRSLGEGDNAAAGLPDDLAGAQAARSS
jgi:heme ABC exporter ATP-binding subunit CcmA